MKFKLYFSQALIAIAIFVSFIINFNSLVILNVKDGCMLDCQLTINEIRMAVAEHISLIIINIIFVMSLILLFIALCFVQKKRVVIANKLVLVSIYVLLAYSFIYLISMIIFKILGMNYPSYLDFIMPSITMIFSIISLIRFNSKRRKTNIFYIYYKKNMMI